MACPPERQRDLIRHCLLLLNVLIDEKVEAEQLLRDGEEVIDGHFKLFVELLDAQWCRHRARNAEEARALTAAEAAALWERGWNALNQAAADQAAHLAAAEPTSLFLRLLLAALGSGRAHVAAPDGNPPMDAADWGWRLKVIGTGEHVRDEWQPQGRRIGWVEDSEGHLYIEADAASAEAQRLAGEQGESLTVAPRTLNKRLHAGQFDKDGKWTTDGPFPSHNPIQENKTMAPINVGRFSWDAETGTLAGPKDVMLELGSALLEKILAGEDPVFNMTAHLSPTIPVAGLVRLQTCLAAWLGERELLCRIK